MMEDQSNKRIAKNSIYMSIRMVVVLIISLYTTRAVLSVLGVEDYGVYNVVAGFVSMFVFLNTSMSNATQRFYNYELGKNGEDGANNVYNVSLIIQFFLSLIVIIATETFGLWYLYNKMVIPSDRVFAAVCIFHLSVFSMFFTIMNVPYRAAIMAHEKMDFYALLGILDAIFKLVIVIFLPYIPGDKLILYGILYLCINVINFLLSFIYVKKNFAEIYINFKSNTNLFKEMLSFTGWNFFGSFSGIMKEQGLNLLLNLFFGPVVNAARGIANQVNGALQGFIGNITVPVRPQVIKSFAAENYTRTMSLTYSISKLSAVFLLVISLPVIYEIDFILDMWLGENVPEHTNTFVIIVILISFVNNLNAAVSGVIHASGKMMKYQVVTSSISLLSLPAAYIVLRLGATPEFAMIMVLVFVFISQIVSLKILQGIIYFPMREYLSKVIYPFLLTVLLTVFVPYIPRLFFQESMLRFILTLIVSIFFSIITVYFISLNSAEKILIKQLFEGIKNKISIF